MFSENFLNKIFENKDLQTIPCGLQSTAIHAFENILSDLAKENEYARISELLSTDESATELYAESEFATDVL